MATGSYQQMIFINLAVDDLTKSRKFFEEIGYSFNPFFSDENTACLVISDTIYAMLMTKERLADFAKKPLADSTRSTAVLLCLSAETRADVDRLADAALAAGGTPAAEPVDYGLMYGRSFYDPDGHHWEVTWMDATTAEEPV
ncbi:Glyoxalase-like domain protein [Streptomyces sp. YIM 130001]|uniref:VOC family protein n=1 Tax=Streptomyces sp. YIM 130001 TaxID=2259644 RepID=UPI000E648D47|nr:VOC family protein [Streptomyces sp. YIM 130001]RII09600.1 Glyoxalase-like domain protein [Streptomyces sp. YIM 130001]